MESSNSLLSTSQHDMQGQSARYNAISCGVDGEKGKTGKLKRGWETARDNLGKAR